VVRPARRSRSEKAIRAGPLHDTPMSSIAQEGLVIQNRLAEFARLERWLADVMERWAVPPAVGFSIDLVINEIVTNVISYGYRDATVHDISITLSDASDFIVVEVVDDGDAFNPFDAPAIEPSRDLESASIGGRGIQLIKAYADRHEYRREEGKNHVAVTINKECDAGSIGQP
jgi:anti-sigma regulatory factor (Ser/Thr protein kinase)